MAFFRNGLPLLNKMSTNPHAQVGHWLFATAGMVVGMIHVGGVTRLTQSGLSMTTWSPLGSLPPLNVTEWELEFDRYKQFPEWQQRQNMTLSEFQFIYAWEYGHRMLGRAVGLVFMLPWAYFSLRGRIPAGYQSNMAVLGTMGATQGAVGWWMVKSGLGEDRRDDRKEIRVKPVRLATHLTMAVATYAGLLWTGLGVYGLPHQKNALKLSSLKDLAGKFPDAFRKAARLRTGAVGLTHLTALTIVSGALVAGNDAGRAFNSFPLMDGQLIPSDILELVPWQRNLVENTATVQWNHRLLGSATALMGLSVAAYGLMPGGNAVLLLTPQVRNGLYAVGLATAGQFTLGISTLLCYVPISLAAAHQLGSIVVFTSGIYLVHALRYSRPAVVRAVVRQVSTTAARKAPPAAA